jgi:hypothetical protein
MLDSHLKSMTYIGSLKVKDQFRLDYIRPEGMRWKDVHEMGDIVYFMIVDGELMKIGKAGGKTGWNGRVGMYKNGITPRGDQTNVRIFKVLKEMDKLDSTIEVYAISVPRQKITFTCPLTCDIMEEEFAVNGNVEIALTAKYLDAGYELPFSNQLR